ncbi:MAG: PIN domain-containing protein [Syntrophomonas sp.]
MAQVEQLVKQISEYHNIMLDTNAVIYFLDGTPNLSELVSPFFELVEQGASRASLSVITEAEVLVKPYKYNNSAALDAVKFFFQEFPNLNIINVDREISQVAAKIWAESGLRLPDAFILATALHNKCDLLLGNDIEFMKKASSYLPTIVLNNFV